MGTRNKHSSNAIKPCITGLEEGLAIVLYKNTRPKSANVRSLMQAIDWLDFPDFEKPSLYFTADKTAGGRLAIRAVKLLSLVRL